MRRRTLAAWIAFSWLVLLSGCASTPGRAEALRVPVRVLILGDSISIGYTPFVREALGAQAVVVRPMQEDGERAENCAGTNKGVQELARWLALEGGDWDVIHFNFGLHDLKRVDAATGRNSNDPDDPHRADPARYADQLDRITRALLATGARVVFATTTPVPEGDLRPYREPQDAVQYNALAVRVMEANGVRINDLFAFVEDEIADLQQPENVHFTQEGSRRLGERVADVIRETSGWE